MTKDCNTCIHKEGSCYPSTTIFDKDKTCKSYIPDYEGYIAELEKENAFCEKACEGAAMMYEHLTKAKELLNEFIRISKASDEDFEHDYSELIAEAEQFLNSEGEK